MFFFIFKCCRNKLSVDELKDGKISLLILKKRRLKQLNVNLDIVKAQPKGLNLAQKLEVIPDLYDVNVILEKNLDE